MNFLKHALKNRSITSKVILGASILSFPAISFQISKFRLDTVKIARFQEDALKYSREDLILNLSSIEQWNTIVEDTKNVYIVDFYANWCTPCLQLTPILEKKVLELKGKVILLKVDIDKHPEIAEALKVNAVPYLLRITKGSVSAEIKGYPPNDRILDNFLTP